jgi:bifunctional DNA-binding transcriptional regulator/antitoxin component of YhaV-PrlF toxin-antitoxin module
VARFTARLEPIESGTFVVIPAEVVEALGATGRTSVVGTIDGQPMRHQFMPYVVEGVGRQVVMAVNKATREAIGKNAGDTVDFDLERDERSRSADIVIPTELAEALAGDPAAGAAFAALAPSHRREFADRVAEAKRPETRLRRAAQAIERLRT